MCGIAGYFGIAQQSEDRNKKLEKLLNPIRRRGPDSTGLWTNLTGTVGFCHSRLSIIDLSPTGHQPMTSQCGNFTIAFNGEIYNFRELEVKKKLKGSSDTEVLLEFIAENGVEYALSKIEGMFAFGLWDDKKGTLTLARDRLGEKPLYYAISRQCFLFSSEPSSFKEHPDFDSRYSEIATSEYFRLGYIPGELSIYENARKLLPGHFISLTTVPRALSQINPMPFWQAKVPPAFAPSEIKETLDSLEAILEKAVKEVMISDAPLGVFLSGGIDSSLVASFAAKADQREKLKTFSIGFQEKDHDESHFAAEIASFLGSDHSSFRFSEKEIWEFAQEMPKIYSEPFADSSQVATALLAREAKKKIKVALTGDGGDEIFFGYNRHKFLPQVLYWKNKIPLLSHHLKDLPLLSKIGSLAGIPNWEDKWNKIRRILESPNLNEAYRTITSNELKAETFLLHPYSQHYSRPHEEAFRNLSAPEFIRMMDIYEYMPGDVLTKVDRASMAFGLETRAPLLHPKVVNFALNISSEDHMRDGKLKFILKALLKRRIPERLWNRPKKGFSIPLHSWLRGPLRDWASALLTKDSLRQSQIFIPGSVENIWDDFLKERTSHTSHHTLWTILQYQAWIQSQK